jgi:hypothetical protein
MAYVDYKEFDPSKLVLGDSRPEKYGATSHKINYTYDVEEGTLIAPLRVLGPEVFSSKGILHYNSIVKIYLDFSMNREFVTDFIQVLYNYLSAFRDKIKLRHPLDITRDKEGNIIKASNYFHIVNNSSVLDKLYNYTPGRGPSFKPFICFPNIIFYNGEGMVASYISSVIMSGSKSALLPE